MKAFLTLYFGVLSTVLCAHGRHSEPHELATPPAYAEAVEVLEKGGAIAVKRAFPLSLAQCTKTYDAHESYCYVEFLKNNLSHHDYTFTLPTIVLANSDQVTVDADERGYYIYYAGEYLKKEEQLAQIEVALKKLTSMGHKEINVQLFRAKDDAVTPLIDFKETKLGDMIGVLRKVPIDYADCEKAFDVNACWVKVIGEEVPDHPGPAAGGDISKSYAFSDKEKVSVSLESLYTEYLVFYEGPETDKAAILKKIQTALTVLKGGAKELTLECSMFTVKKAQPSLNDKLVGDASFFEVAMPLTFEICKDSLQIGSRSCRGDFANSVTTSSLDHPGGDEWIRKQVENEGSIDVFGTYVAGNPFWKLNYELNPATVLSPLEFLEKNFKHLKKIISGYGFRTK